MLVGRSGPPARFVLGPVEGRRRGRCRGAHGVQRESAPSRLAADRPGEVTRRTPIDALWGQPLPPRSAAPEPPPGVRLEASEAVSCSSRDPHPRAAGYLLEISGGRSTRSVRATARRGQRGRPAGNYALAGSLLRRASRSGGTPPSATSPTRRGRPTQRQSGRRSDLLVASEERIAAELALGPARRARAPAPPRSREQRTRSASACRRRRCSRCTAPASSRRPRRLSLDTGAARERARPRTGAELRDLHQRILRHRPLPRRSWPIRRSAVTAVPPNPLRGRERELRRSSDLVDAPRCAGLPV